MKVVELHPEDLLDKLESGALTSGERGRLESHLRACSECRFEVAVRGDLADEALAPRGRRPPLLPASEAPQSSRPSVLRRGRPPRRSVIIAALAAALFTGGALAAVVTEVVRGGDEAPLRRVEPSMDARARRQDRPAARPQMHHSGSLSAAPDESKQAVTEPVQAEPGVPSPAPPASAVLVASDAKASPAPVPRNTHPMRAGGNRATLAREPHRRTAPPAGADAPTAASLFGAANRARRYGETPQAMALYRTLQERFPASEEARLSRATVASLALDRGDPGAALEGFDRYLEQGGSALGVEALVGKAVALQELGRASAELAAWKDVVRRFPGTVHARRAAVRIATLSGR